MKVCPVGADVLRDVRMDGRTDRHIAANNRFSVIVL